MRILLFAVAGILGFMAAASRLLDVLVPDRRAKAVSGHLLVAWNWLDDRRFSRVVVQPRHRSLFTAVVILTGVFVLVVADQPLLLTRGQLVRSLSVASEIFWLLPFALGLVVANAWFEERTLPRLLRAATWGDYWERLLLDTVISLLPLAPFFVLGLLHSHLPRPSPMVQALTRSVFILLEVRATVLLVIMVMSGAWFCFATAAMVVLRFTGWLLARLLEYPKGVINGISGLLAAMAVILSGLAALL
jgi:hypothetical protein